MTCQDEILRACNHSTSNPCEVSMGAGEILRVCADCWNASVAARRTERKTQLAEHWRQYREEQAREMTAVGAHVGQRVQYFCRSMLGFGGILITGQIVTNRNGVAVVRLDRLTDGERYTQWNTGWHSIPKTTEGK